MFDALIDAAIRELPKFLGSLLLLGLVWLVGHRLTVKWNLRQKRRELDLAAVRNFHALYGEFFASWKLWNYLIRDVGAEHLNGGTRWDILKRACEAEGRLEALLVGLSCDRSLSDPEVKVLGRFRQLYQCLRQAIRDNHPLRWDSSDHPDYVAFKELAPEIALLIVGVDGTGRQADDAARTVRRITSNQWEPSVRLRPNVALQLTNERI